MCECEYAVSLTLLTAMCVLSGVVKVASRVCEEEMTAGAGRGVDVRVQATCYPNGTLSYNWNSDPTMYHLQIEYQCFYNGTFHQQTPKPVGALLWSDYRSGHRILSVQPWEEGTFCIFSGCYENGDDYMIYSIPNTTCTIHTVMTMSSSPGLHTASTSLLPTPSVSPIPHDPPHAPKLQQAHITLSAHLTPSPTTTPLSQAQMETSTTMLPAVTDLPTGIAVAAVLFVVAMMCVIAIAVVVIFSDKRKRSMWDLRMFKGKEMVDATYNPVSLQQCNIAESKDTLLDPLERPKLQINIESYECTPRAYVKHTTFVTIETDAALLSEILVSPDDCISVTESANSGAHVTDSVSVGTLRSVEEDRNEVVDPTETAIDCLQEKMVEEEEEKMEGQELCLDGSGYVEGNFDMYESLESTKCQSGLPVSEIPINEPFELELPCGDSSSGSFCIDDGHLHSFSHECADTSRSSGYISNQP